MTDLNRETSLVLHYMTAAGIAVLVLGLLMHSYGFSEHVLLAGVAILVFAPMAGVLVSTACLARMKDIFWLKVALALIAVICAGLVISYFG